MVREEEVLEDGDAVELEEVVEPEELEDARAGHEHEDEFTDEVMGSSFSQDLFLIPKAEPQQLLQRLILCLSTSSVPYNSSEC